MTKAVVSAIKSIKGVGISSVQMTHAAGCKEVRVCSTANVITVGQRGVIRPPIPTRVELCQIVSAKVVQTSASDV